MTFISGHLVQYSVSEYGQFCQCLGRVLLFVASFTISGNKGLSGLLLLILLYLLFITFSWRC